MDTIEINVPSPNSPTTAADLLAWLSAGDPLLRFSVPSKLSEVDRKRTLQAAQHVLAVYLRTLLTLDPTLNKERLLEQLGEGLGREVVVLDDEGPLYQIEQLGDLVEETAREVPPGEFEALDTLLGTVVANAKVLRTEIEDNRRSRQRGLPRAG